MNENNRTDDLDILSDEDYINTEYETKQNKPVKRTILLTLGVFVCMSAMAFTALAKTPDTINTIIEAQKKEALITEIIFSEEDTNVCAIMLNDGEDILPIKGEGEECKVKVGDKIKF